MSSQAWSEIQGGVYGNPELSKDARVISRKQTKLYEAVTKATEYNIGKKSGDKVACRLVGRITTLATTALQEWQKLPFGKAPEYTKQITVYRRGFATVWTGSRQDLDRVSVEDKSIESLRDHAARTLNSVVKSIATASQSFAYVPLTASTYNFDTDGSPTGTAAAAFTLWHLRKMLLKANQYNIPPADGQNWWFFGSPRIQDDLLNDVASGGFVDISKYDSSRTSGLLAGEIGKVGSVRIVIDNDVLTDTIGSGSAYGQGFLFGQDAIKEVMVYPMHFRFNGNLGGEFANQAGLAWQMMAGWDAEWNYTSNGQANYIAYTSA